MNFFAIFEEKGIFIPNLLEIFNSIFLDNVGCCSTSKPFLVKSPLTLSEKEGSKIKKEDLILCLDKIGVSSSACLSYDISVSCVIE